MDQRASVNFVSKVFEEKKKLIGLKRSSKRFRKYAKKHFPFLDTTIMSDTEYTAMSFFNMLWLPFDIYPLLVLIQMSPGPQVATLQFLTL